MVRCFWFRSPIGRVESGLPALVGQHGVSVEKMENASTKKPEPTDGLRAEYDLDYSEARPNPYAARLKGRAVAVVLGPDVAAQARCSAGRPKRR